MKELLSEKRLLTENEQLRTRLAEAEATLEAIRNGEVDAIVVSGTAGEKIFTLASAETPYRIIIEEMDEGAVTVSEEGTILYCNRRFTELVSLPFDKIIGRNFNHFIHSSEPLQYDLLVREGTAGKDKAEITFLDSHGYPVFLHLSLCLLPQGMIGKICIIVTDITELKQHQQNLQLLVNERTKELEQANQHLRELNATKDKLFSIIAHDLRGPFTSLMGYSDLLTENVRNYSIEKFEKIFFHINSAAKSAYTLLENLLIWARSQNSQLMFKPEYLDISVVVKKIIRSLNSLAQIKNVSVTNLTKSSVMGYADENMLSAILRNLVTNAIKFCNTGGKIEINATSRANSVEISVSDNGVGMDEETKNKLFKVGVKQSLSGTAHEKGTGLGLLICSEFVEKHNGKIWVESKLGEGSKFYFSLPHKQKS